eukprot:TRINITY_DN6362_c0_g1_i3.p3 TRINITY_DN6362_c0_g1~~TRINITY_DN6362_c0_g1_i3.p3  ORF type:complete len:226 (-),score=56.01 TRINITY_DN6362_c0_g1_i3:73-750(-)
MAACLTAPPQPPPPPPVVATVNDTVAPEAVADADAVDGATDGELTAALQKAVVALGYDASLATRRDLVALFGRIAGGAPFPPRFLAFVRAETGVADSERVDRVLRPQVPGVRAAFAAAVQQEEARLVELARLAEAERAREVAAEAARQAKLQSLGPCPAGFAWHREGGGAVQWGEPHAVGGGGDGHSGGRVGVGGWHSWWLCSCARPLCGGRGRCSAPLFSLPTV